jgi:hypothetical protein
LTYKITSNVDVAVEQLQFYEKQIPFANALALTRTAQTVKKLQVREMERVYDRPTRFTLNSLRVIPAKKRQQVQFSKVDFKNENPKGIAPTEFLKAQVFGGQRNDKRSERWLKFNNKIGASSSIVPARGLRLNKFGNVTKGRMTKILSNLNAHFDSRQNTTDNTKRVYFVATIKGTKAIWQRHGRKGRKIKPVFLILDGKPIYRRRHDFHGLSERQAQRLYPRKFQQAWEQATGTARPK